MRFMIEKFLVRISLKFVLKGQIKNQKYPSIGSDNGLSPIRRQAIIWTHADPVHWRIYAALGGNESIMLCDPDRRKHIVYMWPIICCYRLFISWLMFQHQVYSAWINNYALWNTVWFYYLFRLYIPVFFANQLMTHSFHVGHNAPAHAHSCMPACEDSLPKFT